MQFWHWMVLGIALLVIELGVTGTVFLLWLAAAAVATGLALMLTPEMTWQVQIVVFSVAAVVALLATRIWLKRRPIKTDRPALNKRGSAYIGRQFTLQHPIENGSGELIIDDTLWRISGPDVPAGASVVVEAVEGTRLRVTAN